MLSVSPESPPLSDSITWIYSVAVPFYTITDEISFADLGNYWRGETSSLENFSGIYLTPPTKAALETFLGKPDSDVVQTTSQEDLMSLSGSSEDILVILPFEDLNPRWKVLTLDGHSPIQDDFILENYPLSINIWVEGSELITLPESNYRHNKRTTLTMTGVTALTRATAFQMETRGVHFPGQDVVDWLTASNLTHISNEVPFAANCPYPDPVQKDLIFCSNPEYMELFEFVGADVIELTGNHLLDYGMDAMNLTLSMYDEQGLETFGGGWSLSDARTPLKITHHGNQLAFLGCNLPGPYSNFATEERPGAAACGDYGWLIEEIERAKSEEYLPIVSIQYYEDYTSYPSPQMVVDFQRLADAGAIAIFGSQAHTPKIMTFYGDSFIHYGLGNLFFDQMEVYYGDTLMPSTREEFIDRLIFYDGRLISVQLRTAMLEDYARPRPMSTEERQDFLNRIFSAVNE
jgi:poly-gamma-glutamate synthesis protein (capsule biosynthesis protein)